MGFDANITSYDMVIFAIFGLFIARGIWLGFLKQVTGLLALYLGYLVASRYHEQIFPFLTDFSDNPKIVFLASYAILFIATYVVVMLLGRLLAFVIELTITGWFDRILGAVLGFAKALIVVVMLHMILGAVLAPENPMLRSCQSCEILNRAVDLSRELIRSEDVRKSLIQQKPAISLDAVKEYLRPSKDNQGVIDN